MDCSWRTHEQIDLPGKDRGGLPQISCFATTRAAIETAIQKLNIRPWWNMTFPVDQCHFPPHTFQMENRQESRIKEIGIFTLAQAKDIGLSQQSL